MARTAKSWYDKRKGCYTVWFHGKRVRLLTGKQTRENTKTAKERLADLLYAGRHADPSPTGKVTVAAVITSYKSHAELHLGAYTYKCMKPYLTSFSQKYGEKLVADCTPSIMSAWLKENPTWKSDWTKSFALRSVQTAFNWAAKGQENHRLIPVNPFKGTTHPVGEPRRDITPDEFQRLLRATGTPLREKPLKRDRKLPTWKKPTPGARFRQIAIFLWRTGCRPSEASKLKWAQIDFDRCVATLKQHKTSRTQRKAMPRIIPLDDVCLKLLKGIKARGEGEYVFLNHRKLPWTKSALIHRIWRARKTAGVPEDAKLYGIRHAFGTRGVLHVPIKLLSAVMGHTSTRTTEIYAHLAGRHDDLLRAMKLINGQRQSD